MSNEFTFTYDATAGILIAAALREKAEAETRSAGGNDINARVSLAMEDGLHAFYAEQSRVARNNAELLTQAADDIVTPVREALAEDMGNALETP